MKRPNNPKENFCLKLNRPVGFSGGKVKYHALVSNENNYEEKLRKHWLKKLDNFSFDAGFLNDIARRQYLNAQLWLGKKKVKRLKTQNDWRMAVGMGGASVFENSMALHHVCGIPYIPASGVKGLVRNWALNEFSDDPKQAEYTIFTKDKIEHHWFVKIFGSPESVAHPEIKGRKDDTFAGAQKGKIIFFDAFPIEGLTVSLDIMNNHSKPYYNPENTVNYPSDWFNPGIINFLSLRKARFQFMLGVRTDEEMPYLMRAFEWLFLALTQHGIGAKTAVGYGYMQDDRLSLLINHAIEIATGLPDIH